MNKGIKIILITLFIAVVIVVFDAAQAVIFDNSPIISVRKTLPDEDSWVDRGLIVDAYYCTKEEDIISLYILLKTTKFTCPIE